MKEKILNFFESMVLVLLEPEKFFHQITGEDKTRMGLYYLVFFSAFLGFMMGGLLHNFVLGLMLALLFVILALIKVLVWSGITHLIAKYIFKGEGKFSTVYCLFGFSTVAMFWGILALALLMVSGGMFLAALILCLLMIFWMVILLTVALEEEHKIGLGRSFLSVLGIPFLVIAIIALIMGVL